MKSPSIKVKVFATLVMTSLQDRLEALAEGPRPERAGSVAAL